MVLGRSISKVNVKGVKRGLRALESLQKVRSIAVCPVIWDGWAIVLCGRDKLHDSGSDSTKKWEISTYQPTGWHLGGSSQYNSWEKHSLFLCKKLKKSQGRQVTTKSQVCTWYNLVSKGGYSIHNCILKKSMFVGSPTTFYELF